MSDRLAALSDAELGRALSQLGAALAYPEVPDLAPAVVERVAGAPAPRPAVIRFPVPMFPVPRLPRVLAGRRVALALAAVFVLAGAAVAGGLLVRGVRILVAPESPRPPPGATLFLGTRTSLADARQRVEFPVLVPTAPGLPSPVVYVDDDPPGGRVSLVYPVAPGLPETPETGVGMLVTQFRGQFERVFIEKLVQGGEQVEEIEVAGSPGYWIEGRHTVAYLDEDGTPFQETFRVAGNTLLWQRGEITFRLESALSKEEALRIAESMR